MSSHFFPMSYLHHSISRHSQKSHQIILSNEKNKPLSKCLREGHSLKFRHRSIDPKVMNNTVFVSNAQLPANKIALRRQPNTTHFRTRKNKQTLYVKGTQKQPLLSQQTLAFNFFKNREALTSKEGRGDKNHGIGSLEKLRNGAKAAMRNRAQRESCLVFKGWDVSQD